MNWLSLAAFIGLVFAVVLLGGQWGANDWYRSLKKPSFTPPNWLFGVAWPILYVLIAISGWQTWESVAPLRPVALGLWGLQLAINASWSYLFFGRRNMTAGLIDIGALWISIAAYMLVTAQFNLTATALFLPYFLWVSFASALNYRIWVLNMEVG